METKVIEGVLVVELPFERIDAGNAPMLKRDLAALWEEHDKVVFEMSKVHFIDSSGLGVMLSCLRELNAKDGDLKLAGMTKSVRSLFGLVRMHRVFEILVNVEAAILAFKR